MFADLARFGKLLQAGEFYFPPLDFACRKAAAATEAAPAGARNEFSRGARQLRVTPMRLLDRFLLRDLVIPSGVLPCRVFDVLGFVRSVQRTRRFQADHLLAGDIVEVYWVRLPDSLVIVLPVGFLLALLYTLANHSRHHEITAMRSAGISLWRICVPYFVVGNFFRRRCFG